MKALGIDIGAHCGVALLDASGRQPRLLDACAVTDDLIGVLEVRFFGQHTIDAVGIETPTQVFEHGRAKKSPAARRGIEKALLASTPQVGEVRAVARLRSQAEVFEGQAHEVRRAVLGKLPRSRTEIDRLVRVSVPLLVQSWPRASNDHVRDAAVAALWAIRKARLGRAS